jgi:predicted ATP-dependent serine protease
MKKMLKSHYGSGILIGEMKVIKSNNQFIRAVDVKIPEIYNRRFKTGEEDLDALFGGQGFLPGMSFTLAAGPGTGKTTLLIQMLEKLENTGKKTAYVSAEESVEQLAFTCKRLGVEAVSVANMTNIEDIFDAVKKNKFDVVILDSLPALTSRKKLRGRRLEEYLSNYIVTKAKELEVVTGVILHFTKTGTYKGSTLLPHSVDCNIVMTKAKDNPTVREIDVTKNRFGVAGYTAFMMTERGFDFQKVEVAESDAAPIKKGKKAQYIEALTNAVKQNGQINLKTATDLLGCSLKAQNVLRELVLVGTVQKTGRGTTAIWTS